MYAVLCHSTGTELDSHGHVCSLITKLFKVKQQEQPCCDYVKVRGGSAQVDADPSLEYFQLLWVFFWKRKRESEETGEYIMTLVQRDILIFKNTSFSDVLHWEQVHLRDVLGTSEANTNDIITVLQGFICPSEPFLGQYKPMCYYLMLGWLTQRISLKSPLLFHLEQQRELFGAAPVRRPEATLQGPDLLQPLLVRLPNGWLPATSRLTAPRWLLHCLCFQT